MEVSHLPVYIQYDRYFDMRFFNDGNILHLFSKFIGVLFGILY